MLIKYFSLGAAALSLMLALCSAAARAESPCLNLQETMKAIRAQMPERVKLRTIDVHGTDNPKLTPHDAAQFVLELTGNERIDDLDELVQDGCKSVTIIDRASGNPQQMLDIVGATASELKLKAVDHSGLELQVRLLAPNRIWMRTRGTQALATECENKDVTIDLDTEAVIAWGDNAASSLPEASAHLKQLIESSKANAKLDPCAH